MQRTDHVGVELQAVASEDGPPWALGTVPLEELSLNAGIVIPTPSSSNDRLTSYQSTDNRGSKWCSDPQNNIHLWLFLSDDGWSIVLIWF